MKYVYILVCFRVWLIERLVSLTCLLIHRKSSWHTVIVAHENRSPPQHLEAINGLATTPIGCSQFVLNIEQWATLIYYFKLLYGQNMSDLMQVNNIDCGDDDDDVRNSRFVPLTIMLYMPHLNHIPLLVYLLSCLHIQTFI